MWPLTKWKESCAVLLCPIDYILPSLCETVDTREKLAFLGKPCPPPLSLCAHSISLFDWFSRILLSVLDLMLREGISQRI